VLGVQSMTHGGEANEHLRGGKKPAKIPEYQLWIQYHM